MANGNAVGYIFAGLVGLGVGVLLHSANASSNAPPAGSQALSPLDSRRTCTWQQDLHGMCTNPCGPNCEFINGICNCWT